MPRLSPVNQARWARFRHNRRGYWSLWIFAVLFVLSLFSELIANDKPLLVHFNDRWYVPVIASYSESDFGGPFATPAEFQDPWLRQQMGVFHLHGVGAKAAPVERVRGVGGGNGGVVHTIALGIKHQRRVAIHRQGHGHARAGTLARLAFEFVIRVAAEWAEKGCQLAAQRT